MVLSDANTHILCSHTCVLTVEGKKQRLTVELTQWNALLLRGSNDFSSNQHPINVVRVLVKNMEGKPVFKRPLWIGVMGKRREEVSIEEAYHNYSQRYDIEHFFRFGKQNLLIDAYQTPDIEHEKLWWQFAPLAYVQLYLAAQLGELSPKPWERYLKDWQNAIGQQEAIVKTPAQAQRAFGKLLQEIGTLAIDCIPRGNPVGRKIGEQPSQRPDFKIHFKESKKTKSLENGINSSSVEKQNLSNISSIDELLAKVKIEIKKKGFSTKYFAEKLLL